jgi:hypothetical protein
MTEIGHGGGNDMSDKPAEEYLLFVRIPDEVDQSREDTGVFLKRLAKLLSDDDQRIYVEEYITYDEDNPKMPRGKHEDDGQGYRGNSPAGGRKSSLQPMYFCHNKF